MSATQVLIPTKPIEKKKTKIPLNGDPAWKVLPGWVWLEEFKVPDYITLASGLTLVDGQDSMQPTAKIWRVFSSGIHNTIS